MAGDTSETVLNGALGALAGGAYGFIIFARKRESTKRETEKLDLAKLIPTVLVAAGIGAIDGAASGPEAITVAGISTRLATYAGAVFALEQVYKLARDRYRNQKATSSNDTTGGSTVEERRAERKRGRPETPTETDDETMNGTDTYPDEPENSR